MLTLLFATAFGLGSNDAVSQGAALSQRMKARPGQRIAISNQFGFGSISVIGWDEDAVEATATTQTQGGEHAVPVRIANDPSDGARMLVTTAPATPQRLNEQVHLFVKVPRDAQLDPIYVPKAETNVTDINKRVEVRSDSGRVTVSRVGATTIRTGSGEIHVSDVAGDVSLRTSSAEVVVTRVNGNITADAGSANLLIAQSKGLTTVTTTTGNLNVDNAMGDVRVTSINGRTNIRCAKGRVDVSDTSGVITLSGIDGDVDVMTSAGRATLRGWSSAARHYRLRTLSGSVTLILPEDATDFTATLSSYNGKIRSAFPAVNDAATQSAKKERRLISKSGNGRATIELDSFDGPLVLDKTKTALIAKCDR